MIYLDNAATTYQKPENVINGLTYSSLNFGSPNRGGYDISINSSKMVFETREKISKFFGVNDPLMVSFTSNATESLNLVINSVLKKSDHVITTCWEHNSVIRPLVNNEIEYSTLKLDNNFKFNYEDLNKILKKNTKAVIMSHGSNITGNLIDINIVSSFCKKNNLLFILDIAQTGGLIPINITNDNIDIICFTGHKSLYGISGIGGICVNPNLKINFKTPKVGGAGHNSLKLIHSNNMPECFEAGTSNFIGIYSLYCGIDFILKKGIVNILNYEIELMDMLYNGIKNLNGINIIGNFKDIRTPIISFTFKEFDANDFVQLLWEEYSIAVRGGHHCAPLIHENIGTIKTGVVRLSISAFNTKDEILQAIKAIEKIITL